DHRVAGDPLPLRVRPRITSARAILDPVVAVHAEGQPVGRLEDRHDVEHVALGVIVVGQFRPTYPIEQHVEWTDRCQGELRTERLRVVIVAQQVPSVYHLEHAGDFAREGVARLDAGGGEWNGVA